MEVKSRSNLELSKRTKERRCTARKPNLWIGEHENQFLLCVLFSFVVHSIGFEYSIREVKLNRMKLYGERVVAFSPKASQNKLAFADRARDQFFFMYKR